MIWCWGSVLALCITISPGNRSVIIFTGRIWIILVPGTGILPGTPIIRCLWCTANNIYLCRKRLDCACSLAPRSSSSSGWLRCSLTHMFPVRIIYWTWCTAGILSLLLYEIFITGSIMAGLFHQDVLHDVWSTHHVDNDGFSNFWWCSRHITMSSCPCIGGRHHELPGF